jgi:ankyrin repeat protein
MRVTLLNVTAAALLLVGAQVYAQQTETITTSNTTLTEATKPEIELEKLTEAERTALVFQTITSGDTNALKPLLRSLTYYRHNEAGETALTQAIINDDAAMVQVLVRDAVINLKNKAGETPLTLSLKKGNPEIIQMVVRRAKASLRNDQGEAPLMLAIERFDDLFLLQTLIDKGADVNRLTNGITPIARATAKNDVQTVALLLRNGADPSIPSTKGELPLLTAVQNNYDVIAGILLHKSTQPTEDANWKTQIGETLLNIAAAQGNTRIVSILLEYGADPAAVDYLENTALHIAAENGYTDMARRLIEKGAPADQMNIMGTTPIMAAAQNQHEALAELFAEQGADAERRNFAGVAANDYGSYAVRASIEAEYEELANSQPQSESQKK